MAGLSRLSPNRGCPGSPAVLGGSQEWGPHGDSLFPTRDGAMPGAAGGPGRALPRRVCPLPLPAAGSKVPREGRAGGGRRRRQELPQGSAPLLSHPSVALAGFGPPAAPGRGAWWPLPWGHSSLPRRTTAPQPRGRSPSSLGTVSPRPRLPHPSTRTNHGHSTTRSIVPHPRVVSLSPWGLRPLTHGDHSPSATRVVAPHPWVPWPLARPRAAPLPRWVPGPRSPRRCPAGPQPCGQS